MVFQGAGTKGLKQVRSRDDAVSQAKNEFHANLRPVCRQARNESTLHRPVLNKGGEIGFRKLPKQTELPPFHAFSRGFLRVYAYNIVHFLCFSQRMPKV